MVGGDGPTGWALVARKLQPGAAFLVAMGLSSAGLAGVAERAEGVAAAAGTPSRWGLPLAAAQTVDRPFASPSSNYAAGHRGVDLRATAGDPVLAAGAGRVSFAGLLAGRGVIAVVHPGGLRTTYEPVTAVVGVGQLVARGDVLGRLGTGHASCRVGTDCVHWGLLRGDSYLDPMSLLSRPRLRLLPLGGASTDPAADRPPSTATAGRAGLRPLSVDLSRPAIGAPPPSDLIGESVGFAERARVAAATGALAVVLALRTGRQRRRAN